MRLAIHGCFATRPLRRGVLMTATATAAALGACSTQATQATQAAQAMPATQTIPSIEVAQPASTPIVRIAGELVDAFDPPPPGAATANRGDLARLLGEGEAAYRARSNDAALAAFERVVALDPDHALSWLRIGNLHQQRRDWFKALGAYRRAASRSGGEGFDPALRAKALYNLAIINLELAQQTLRTLERIGPPAAAAGPREPLSAAVSAARQRLEAFAPPREPAASQASAPAPRAPSRTASSRGVPPRGEPEPEPELPRIDYIRGAPRP
mgnify:CR=1 FL=1